MRRAPKGDPSCRVATAALGLLLTLAGCARGGPARDAAGGPARPGAPARPLVTDGYADPRLCAHCHEEIARSYREVAMARSMSRPDPGAVVEDYATHNRLEHEPSGFVYEMRRDGDRFYQRRMARDRSGALGRPFDCEVTYVIGSGRHARSYLHRDPDGTLIELPVTWYTQEKRWAMSPGYDRPNQFDFSRRVTYACLFCHTGTPPIPRDADRPSRPQIFPEAIPLGIDCQRCHGPGARHAELAFGSKATREEIRAAIVNPARLPPGRQMDVCMQCHLQTTSDGNWSSLILAGRGVYSFRPGEDLAEYRVELDRSPRPAPDERFEIDHQAYQFRRSACFVRSGGRLTCLTCHDPHRRPDDPAALYSSKCLGCHRRDDCPPARVAAARGGDAGPCTRCHMPARRTDDVVHVVMTDHRIGIHSDPERGLAPRREAPSPYRGAIAYDRPDGAPPGAWGDLYLGIAEVLDGVDPRDGLPRLESAVRSVRPGFADPYLQLGITLAAAGRLPEASDLLTRAATLDPGNPRILLALGNALAGAGRVREALARYDEAVAAWPSDAEALTNSGNLLFQAGRPEEALGRYDRALAARPDNAEAESNRGAALLRLGRTAEAIEALERAVTVDPRRVEAFNNLAIALRAAGRARDAARAASEADLLRHRPGR